MLKLKRVKRTENKHHSQEREEERRKDGLFQKKLVKYLLKQQKQLNTIWLRCNSSQQQLILEVLSSSHLSLEDKMKRMRTIELGYRLKLIWGMHFLKDTLLIRESEPFHKMPMNGLSTPDTPEESKEMVSKTPNHPQTHHTDPKKRYSLDIPIRVTVTQSEDSRKSYSERPERPEKMQTPNFFKRIKGWKGSFRHRSSSLMSKAVTTPHTPKKDWELMKNALKSIVSTIDFSHHISAKEVASYIDHELASDALPNISKYKPSHTKMLKKVKCSSLGAVLTNEKIDGFVLQHLSLHGLSFHDLFEQLNIPFSNEIWIVIDRLTSYTQEEWLVKKKYDASPLLKSKYAHKDQQQFIKSLANPQLFMEEFLPVHRRTEHLKLMIPINHVRSLSLSSDNIQSPLVSPLKTPPDEYGQKIQDYVQNELFDFSESTMGDEDTYSEQDTFDEDEDVYPDTEIQLENISILNQSTDVLDVDEQTMERSLPVKLVLSELRMSRMRRMVMNQLGPLVTNYSNMNTIGGLCFHSGLVIGPYYFEWNASELVIPRSPSSRLGFISLEIDRINLKTFKEQTRFDISNFITNWNANRSYANVGNNCQNFVEHMISLLEINCPYLNEKHGGAISRYLHSLKKKGLSHFKLPLNAEFKKATNLTMENVKEHVLQHMTLSNDILDHTIAELKKDHMYFSNHATVDSFCNYIRDICPSVDYDFNEEWQLLKAFDRAFWMRSAALPGKQGDPLEDQCPFGNPSLQSFCLSPFTPNTFTP